MPARQSIATTATCNQVGEDPRELEARADEHDAKAYDMDAAAAQERAAATRLRATAKRHSALPSIETIAVHLTRAEYARRSSVSEATVGRWLTEGMPALPVGTTVRIDPAAADEWRRARGRRPTTASAKAADVDVDAELGRAGLRVLGGGRR